MMLTSNPTDARLKFVWDKQKPQVDPRVMMDVIAAVADRVAPVTSSREVTWADRIEDAGRKADLRFVETFDRWRHSQTGNSVPGEIGWIDAPFVDAVVALVTEMPEFKKASPIDGLIPWFAKEMNRLFLLSKAVNAPEYPAYYDAKYARLQQALSEDPVLVEWFEKKKPNLSKMDASDVFTDIEAFEEDREPQVVYPPDGKKTRGWDGWDVVKLATKTQIQKVGEELDNCLQKGSSYTEGYCKLAKSGESEFFALREDGEPVLSIQWTPGKKDPEQVYGRDNREPEGDAQEKVGEWIESRGGKPRKWSRLSVSAREIAEYIDEHESHDDESVAAYARDWDDTFSVADAKQWIQLVGAYSIDVARAMSDEKLDAEDFLKLPDVVREYLHEYADSKETSEIISLGLLANEMDLVAEDRGNNQPRGTWVSEAQQGLRFAEGDPELDELYEATAKRVTEAKQKQERVADKVIRRELKKVFSTSLSADQIPESIIEAKRWYDGGWEDRDYFDEAAKWWAHWFDPEDAAIYFFDMGNYDTKGDGVSLEVAGELRDRGIGALEVADAARVIPGTINLHDADAVAALVEKGREWLKANKRRRTSRRPARRR